MSAIMAPHWSSPWPGAAWRPMGRGEGRMAVAGGPEAKTWTRPPDEAAAGDTGKGEGVGAAADRVAEARHG